MAEIVIAQLDRKTKSLSIRITSFLKLSSLQQAISYQLQSLAGNKEIKIANTGTLFLLKGTWLLLRTVRYAFGDKKKKHGK